MPFDTVLAERIRIVVNSLPEPVRIDMSEKKMFGGLAFLLRGKMTVGIIGDELVVRVVPEKMDEILRAPYTRPMDFSKKPMKEFVFVATEGLETEKQLHYWLALGIEHARRKLTI